jgi:hypothetical protein
MSGRRWSTARNRKKSKKNRKKSMLFRGKGEVTQLEKDFLKKDVLRISNIIKFGRSRRSSGK